MDTERIVVSSRKVKSFSRRKPPRGRVCTTINVTYRCNFSCRHCLQLCDVWKQPDSDVTPEQVDQFVEDSAKLPLHFVRITGGEPTQHPNFADILDYVDERLVRHGPAEYGGVDSNLLGGTIKLPPNWGQISFPDKARHNAMLISPWEIGLQPTRLGVFCRTANRCGIGFDFRGWSFCLIAPNHQAMLGIERKYDGPTSVLDPEVCKHCTWSLSKKQMRWLNVEVQEGRVPWPSEVFKPGLARLGDQAAIHRTLASIGTGERHDKWKLADLIVAKAGG